MLEGLIQHQSQDSFSRGKTDITPLYWGVKPLNEKVRNSCCVREWCHCVPFRCNIHDKNRFSLQFFEAISLSTRQLGLQIVEPAHRQLRRRGVTGTGVSSIRPKWNGKGGWCSTEHQGTVFISEWEGDCESLRSRLWEISLAPGPLEQTHLRCSVSRGTCFRNHGDLFEAFRT